MKQGFEHYLLGYHQCQQRKSENYETGIMSIVNIYINLIEI